MDTANEFSHDVDDWVSWAKDAMTEEERVTFLKMARDWRRAATIIKTQDRSASG